MSEITLGTLHEILVRVEEKVDKTNSRVSKLEAWKNKIIGGLVITNIIILPIAITLFINYL